MLPAIPGLATRLAGAVRTRLLRVLGGTADRSTLVEGIDAAAVRVDGAGLVVDLNQRAVDVLGVERRAALGRRLGTVAPDLADLDDPDGDVVELTVDGAARRFELTVVTDSSGGGAGGGTSRTSEKDASRSRTREVDADETDVDETDVDEADAVEADADEADADEADADEADAGNDGRWLLLRDVTDAERYRRLVENVADAVYMTDPGGEVLAVSDALIAQLGYDREALVGSHVNEFVVDEDYERALEFVSELLAADEDRGTIEGRAVHADGEQRRYEDNVRVLTDEARRLQGTIHSIRDVEERRARERELEQYETIVETVPVGVFVLDQAGAIVAGNERGASMLGYDLESLRGRTFEELQREGVVGPEFPDRETIADSLIDADGSSGSRAYELTVHPADGGGERVVEAQIARQPGEEFSGFIGVLRDVTDRQRRIEELEQYEAIMEVLPDPVYATDAEGRLTFVNRAFEEQLGYALEAGEVHFSEFTTPEDTESILELLREMVDEDGSERATAEIVVVTSDGRHLRVEDSIALLPGEGEFGGSAGVLRDVTERKRRQEILTVMNRALRHNLRTNVTTIVGYADLLDREVEGEAETYVERVRDSAEWLAKLGDTLRTLQRAIEVNITGDLGVDIEEAVESVAADARRDHPAADVTGHVATKGVLEAGKPLEYALQNAVENAILHNDTPEPSVDVWVTDAPREGWVDIHVEDDGPGIPEDERDVVMGDAAITQLKHGSGIGLWLTRWLVEVFDGELVIEDNDPRGSVVTLRLPRSAA